MRLIAVLMSALLELANRLGDPLVMRDAGYSDAALVEYRKALTLQPDDADVAQKIATLEKKSSTR